MALYLDILIFNVHRTVRHSTKTYKQKVLDLKNKPNFKFELFTDFNRSEMFRYFFRKNLHSAASSPAELINVVLLPFPYLLLMTRLMDKFFLKENLRVFNL